MKIKIMFPNRDGRLEFTKTELEKLLEEAYNEGYRDGKNSPLTYYGTADNITIKGYDYTSPSVSYLNGYTTSATSNCVASVDAVKVSGSALTVDNDCALEWRKTEE